MSGHVFLSYARKDGRENVEKLDKALRENGLGTWWDTRDIDPFQDFTAVIEKGIEKSSIVAVCVTPDSKRDDSFVRREIQYASISKKPILALRFADVEPHISIINNQWLDFFKDWDEQLKEFLHIIENRMFGTRSPIQRDPIRRYLEDLYKKLVSDLARDNTKLLDIISKDTPDMVRPIHHLPANYLDFSRRKSERVKRSFENLQVAFDENHQRLLLLGNPGAGKTRSLTAFARDAVVARLEEESSPLPIFCSLVSWQIDYSSLADLLMKEAELFKNIRISQIIDSGNALLMLDGLDELRANVDEDDFVEQTFKLRKSFIDIIPKDTPIIITCRIRDYEELGEMLPLEGAVTLQPLKPTQIKAYLSDIKLDDLWSILEQDKEFLKALETPLMLNLISKAFRNHDTSWLTSLDPHRINLREVIFKNYIENTYTLLEIEEFTVEDIYDNLGLLGIYMLSDHKPNKIIFHTNIFENLFDSKEVAENFKQVAIDLDIVVKYSKGYRFLHLLIRDYLIFSYGMKYLFDGNKYRPENTDIPTKALTDGSDNDGSVKAEKIYRLLNPAQALGMLGDKRAIKSLQNLLGDDRFYEITLMPRSAIWALGKLKDFSSGGLLNEIVDKKANDDYVRMNAIDVLLDLDDSFTIEKLESVAIDMEDSWLVREYAIKIIGNTDKQRAIDILKKLTSSSMLNKKVLADENLKNILEVILASIIEMSSEYGRGGIYPLVNILNNIDIESNLRKDAVEKIAAIGIDYAIADVEKILLDSEDDIYLRRKINLSLKLSENEQAIDLVKHILFNENEEEGMRNIAVKNLCKYLCKNNSGMAKQILIEFSNSQNTNGELLDTIQIEIEDSDQCKNGKGLEVLEAIQNWRNLHRNNS